MSESPVELARVRDEWRMQWEQLGGRLYWCQKSFFIHFYATINTKLEAEAD